MTEGLDEKILDTPWTWRQALTQGSTGVVADPTDEQIENIKNQALALVPVLNLIGDFTISSWLRTPEHNTQVGGAPHSAHLLGLATDFVPKTCTVAEAKQRIINMKIYPGGGEIPTTTWVHLDLKHDHWFYP